MMLGGMNSGHAKLADWGFTHLPEMLPESAVDLGCGGGRNAGELLKMYPKAHVTAVDYSELSVEKAKDYDAGEREKVVITFSGSEGGSRASDTMAWYYKQNGVSALGVTLFAGEETGKYLDRVPLEYAENAIAWLKAQGYEKIAVDGISKGSEYALLAASRFPEISCVVARVPSYFVSEGMIGRNAPSGTSCWSYRGEELCYTPDVVRDFDVIQQLRRYGEFIFSPITRGKT